MPEETPPGMPPGFNMERINRRLEVLNAVSNHAIKEITRGGSLRVYVEKAFNRPIDLVELIAQICVLKQYAGAAAAGFGTPMSLEDWNGFFQEFERACHILPSGKLS